MFLGVPVFAADAFSPYVPAQNEVIFNQSMFKIDVIDPVALEILKMVYVDKIPVMEIAQRYAAAGYKIPRLVFWNVNSRTGTIPVIENDLGVALVSGFSTNIVKMVMSNKTDPYECLLDTLNTERYAPIGEALRNL